MPFFYFERHISIYLISYIHMPTIQCVITEEQFSDYRKAAKALGFKGIAPYLTHLADLAKQQASEYKPIRVPQFPGKQ